jgi:hypothetical protein
MLTATEATTMLRCDKCSRDLTIRNARRLGEYWVCAHCAQTEALAVLSCSGDAELVAEALDLLRTAQGVEAVA